MNFSRKNVKGTADQVSASKNKLPLDKLSFTVCITSTLCKQHQKQPPHSPPTDQVVTGMCMGTVNGRAHGIVVSSFALDRCSPLFNQLLPPESDASDSLS